MVSCTMSSNVICAYLFSQFFRNLPARVVDNVCADSVTGVLGGRRGDTAIRTFNWEGKIPTETHFSVTNLLPICGEDIVIGVLNVSTHLQKHTHTHTKKKYPWLFSNWTPINT